MSNSFRHAGLVVILGGALTGCALLPGDSPEPPANPDGRWLVVDHRMGDISAMDEAQAAQWHGREIRFGSGRVSAGDEVCRNPIYEHRFVTEERFTRASYGLTAAELGARARGDGTIQVTEVICQGERWSSAGGVLIWLDADRALTPWDGVLFELERR